MKIAILGGTGPEGSGLGLRWAAAGHQVVIGSRQMEKGQQVAAELQGRLPATAANNISGADNLSALDGADVAVLSVPYSGQQRTLAGLEAALAGKLLLTVVVPLGEKAARVWRPPSGLAAAEEARQQLGEGARVVAAFQNISAHHLADPGHAVDCDVLVCGDDKADKQVVIDLCAAAGMRGVDAGPLQNASVAEGLTAVLIGINIRHKIKNAGIRITGIG
jgi:8-hydroxy-5-deazaflavin:NADPH oxidoreductase